MPTRRSLVRLAGFSALVAAAYGGTAVLRRLTEPELEFVPLKSVPGFRSVKGGAISGGAAVFLGLEAHSDIPAPRIADSAICTALFGPVPDPGRVQIAYFSDYRCLFCRQVSPILEELAQEGGVQVTWHDLPLLGQVSVRAARAAVAARAQGAYGFFHRRLMGVPVVPSPGYLKDLARDVGIDGDRLLRDMTSAKTQEQLTITAALADRFGFIGTPAMVVGRTSILGGIDRRMVKRLIEAEKNQGQPGPC